MYTIHLTKEELDSAIIQIGARIDELKVVQKEAGKKEDIKRVIDMERFMEPIVSVKEKMMNERYSHPNYKR
ncbi:hypothetical protein P4393_12395 [Bacillus subtilis]|nr:hypothetical protein [Bacillus subtilis]MED3474627.1 hypothetical protein [Bacillus subtilis]